MDWELGAEEGLANYLTETENVYDSMSKSVGKAFSGMEDALVDFTKTGTLDFGKMTDSIINDMMRMAIQQSITRPLASMLGLSLFEQGGSFDSGGIQAFANGGTFSNSIVSSPTLFKFASGTGMMGEAGPEAIMPLKRGPDGKLGVAASGGGASQSTVINISINATVGDVASKSDVEAGMRATANNIVAKIQRSRGYGGALA